MCAKKRHRTSSDYLQYLKDDLSKQDRHELERGLEADPFEKEAMEGLESISPIKAEEDILSLHASLKKRLGRRKRVAWYSIAATAASILLVGSIFLNIYDLNPEEAEREALTEETFRTLGSDDQEAGLAEESTVDETANLDTPIKESPIEESLSEAQTAKRNENPPGEAAETPKLTEDLVVMEYAMTAEEKPEVVTDDEIVAEAEVVEEPEHLLEIVVKEAVPKEKSGSSKKRSKALRSENLPDQASTGELRGVVVSSEDLDPLPGASIVIRGSNSGAVADMEGRFTLPANDSQTTVLASFIGMETEEYKLDYEGENQLVMQPDAQTLDEIVVVAQGSGRLEGLSLAPTTSPETDETTPSYTPAQPADGYKALKNYVEQNMVFPPDYIPGEREVVILRFVVLSSGIISDIQTLRTAGESYTLEAIRLIKEGPAWIPAHISSGPINEQVRVRIVFNR